jgi:hypothetical protein
MARVAARALFVNATDTVRAVSRLGDVLESLEAPMSARATRFGVGHGPAPAPEVESETAGVTTAPLLAR